jgi:hypothetical protein
MNPFRTSILNTILLFVFLSTVIIALTIKFTKTNTTVDREAYEVFLREKMDKIPLADATESKKIPKPAQPDRAAIQNYFMTLDPKTGVVPKERLMQVYNDLKSNPKKNRINPLEWSSTSANMGGRTRAIMWDPNDPQGKKVWAGGVTGGLWYRNDITNNNNEWQPVDDFWSSLNISCITYDPNDPMIFYVGTGEAETALIIYRESSGVGDGIWRSTDGGQTWSLMESTIAFEYVTDLLVRDEGGQSVIYAGVASGNYKGSIHYSEPSDGLFRSEDNGQTWQQVLPDIPEYGEPYAVSDIDMGADGRIYVGTMPNVDIEGGAVILYSDEGLSGSWWVYDNYVQIIENNPQYKIPGRVMVAPAPSDPNIVYAQIAAGYNSYFNYYLGVTQQTTIQLLFPDYCYPTASCSWGDGFTGFALEQINNMTGNGCSPNGYGDYTNMVADLEGGQTYSVQWRTGYSNQRASLWIDLNDNKEFEPSERLITDFVLSSSNQIYTTTFTVPAGSYTGNKRIRIRANWQSSSSDPCSNFTYGETEDYTANFGSQTTLAPPQNVSANVTGNSVVVTWQAPAGADATLLGYNVYRDNQKISNTITSLTYTDTNVPTGSHWYSVCAVYTEGESELAQPVQVNVGSLQGKLQGFIRNAVTNAVIQNAWVSALDSDFGAVTYNTIFGSHYTLYLSAGTYSVSCTAPGFQTLTVNNVVILEGQTKALNFYLHSSSESNLGGEVTGVSYFEFEDFSVYPNPASSEINITTTSAMKHVKIMNNMGQVVFVDGGGDLLIRVNTSGFSRGIYFIEVETENHRFFEKLIIN